MIALLGEHVLQLGNGPHQRTFAPAPDGVPRLHVQTQSLGVRQPPVLDRLLFLRGQDDGQRVRDGRRHPVLNLEDVVDDPIVLLGPQMLLGPCVDELSGDAEPAPGFPHASLQREPDVQLLGDLGKPQARGPVLHGRRAADDSKSPDAGQIGNDLLGQAVTEVGVVRIRAHVGERQHDEAAPGSTVGGGGRREGSLHRAREGGHRGKACVGILRERTPHDGVQGGSLGAGTREVWRGLRHVGRERRMRRPLRERRMAFEHLEEHTPQ